MRAAYGSSHSPKRIAPSFLSTVTTLLTVVHVGIGIYTLYYSTYNQHPRVLLHPLPLQVVMRAAYGPSYSPKMVVLLRNPVDRVHSAYWT